MCCAPLILGKRKALTAEELMRSRYSAYVVANVDYLYETTHYSKRNDVSKLDIGEWAKSNYWQRLEILHYDTETVEFKAHFKNRNGLQLIHHEKSIFCIEAV